MNIELASVVCAAVGVLVAALCLWRISDSRFRISVLTFGFVVLLGYAVLTANNLSRRMKAIEKSPVTESQGNTLDRTCDESK